MKDVRFSILLILLLAALVACDGGNASDDGDNDQAVGDIDATDGDIDKDHADGDSDKNVDGDHAEIDALESENEEDSAHFDGDAEPDGDRTDSTESEPDDDGDHIDNCICDPTDAMSCGPDYHCSSDCLRCEMDNPPDEDEVDGDIDQDNAQPDTDNDPVTEQDHDDADDHDNDPDIDINQSCSYDGDCPYGSYCNFDTTVPQCAVDCVDNIDCVNCCDKALGRCTDCPLEPDADPDSDGTQTYTCPGGQTTECPPGYFCLPNGICDKECDELNPCDEPYACNLHGQCVVPMGDQDI